MINNKILPLLLLLATLFMGIGYASINSLSLEISGTLTTEKQEGIFISSVEYSDSNEDEFLEVISTFQTTLNSKVVLSSNSSYVSYIVTIYNNSDDNYYYTNTTYDSDFYDNSNITYTVTNLGSDILKSNSVSLFLIKFEYQDSTKIDNNVLNSYIKFNFTKIHLVTYENISMDNLPEYVIDNDNLIINLNSNISPSFKVYLNNELTTDYTYIDNILTINNVTSNVLIIGYMPTVNLTSNLIPVVYENDNWIVKSVDDTWYNYDEQLWANAVILKSNVTKNEGDIVDLENDIRGIFVYIPRYEYKISTDSSKEIYVNFISVGTSASEGYIIPDAFTFDSEISGFWIGKFETSMSNQELYVIPNVKATLNQSVSTQYNLAINFNSSLNSHMVKNSEWGATAYLSQSKYGKYGNTDYSLNNREIYVNNSIGLYTGKSSGSTNPEDTTEGTYSYDEGFMQDSEESGIGASTTGNITGVYDMSGGAFEYVMGYYTNNTYNDSGFSSLPNSKYLNSYTSITSSSYPYYSHALYETRGWYDDSATDLTTTFPWYLRGGVADGKETAGIFAYASATGGEGSYATFRLALVTD